MKTHIITPPPDFTFSIAKIISYLSTSQMLAEVLSREPYVTGKARDVMNRIGNRCKCANAEITDLLSPASRKVIRDEVMNPDMHLQIDKIINAMIAMPEGIRDEIESYVMARYNVYADKINKL